MHESLNDGNIFDLIIKHYVHVSFTKLGDSGIHFFEAEHSCGFSLQRERVCVMVQADARLQIPAK